MTKAFGWSTSLAGSTYYLTVGLHAAHVTAGLILMVYLIKKGMTLDQVKAAKPTLDFDPRYGTDSGTWTTAMFVETIYRDLSKKK